MRFYRTFPEALNELRRELKEMGLRLHTKSVQNINIENNPDYEMMEIQNYQYTVTSPDPASIPLANKAWCDAEFAERTSLKSLNPGDAWRLREDYWKQFFSKEDPEKFDYAYPQRMQYQLPAVIMALKKDPMTRRAFLPIFDASEDWADDLDIRIPCSLGYWFYFRQGKLNVTYLQRSADFSEHFNNDIFLADMLKCHVAQACEMEPGTFSHWLGSLHIFAKDVKDVF